MKKNVKTLARDLVESGLKYGRFDYQTVPVVSFMVTVNRIVIEVVVNKYTEQYAAFITSRPGECTPISFHLNHDTNYDAEVWVGTSYHIRKYMESECWTPEFRKLFNIMYKANLPHLGHTFLNTNDVVEFFA